MRLKYKVEDFPFLIKPDKNNKAILKALDEIKERGCCVDGCRVCPFESKGGIGCFSFMLDKKLYPWKDYIEVYKETFFKNDYIQEEMEL